MKQAKTTVLGILCILVGIGIFLYFLSVSMTASPILMVPAILLFWTGLILTVKGTVTPFAYLQADYGMSPEATFVMMKIEPGFLIISSRLYGRNTKYFTFLEFKDTEVRLVRIIQRGVRTEQQQATSLPYSAISKIRFYRQNLYGDQASIIFNDNAFPGSSELTNMALFPVTARNQFDNKKGIQKLTALALQHHIPHETTEVDSFYGQNGKILLLVIAVLVVTAIALTVVLI